MPYVHSDFVETTIKTIEVKTLKTDKWLKHLWTELQNIAEDNEENPLYPLLVKSYLYAVGTKLNECAKLGGLNIDVASSVDTTLFSYHIDRQEPEHLENLTKTSVENYKVAMLFSEFAKSFFDENQIKYQNSGEEQLKEISNFILDYATYKGTIGYLLNNRVIKAAEYLRENSSEDGYEQVPDHIFNFIANKARKLEDASEKRQATKMKPHR